MIRTCTLARSILVKARPSRQCLLRRSYSIIPISRHITNGYSNKIWSTGKYPAYLNFLSSRGYASVPDHVLVKLPALSPTMETGTIISWEKKEGDKLNEGDLLAEIETDKATMGFETPEEGYLAKILVSAGTKDVAIGKLVCIIVPNAEEVAAFKDYTDEGAAPTPPPPPPTQSVSSPPVLAAAPSSPPVPFAPAPSSATASSPGNRIYASHSARSLAAKRGIDLTTIQKGTGMFGSIQASDLDGIPVSVTITTAMSTPPTAASYVDTTVSNIRSVISKRLMQSKQTIPHYYLTSEIEIDTVLALRAQFNTQLSKDKVKLSVNDFVIKAAAMACLKVPEVNSSWMDTVIRQYSSVDVSVAVSTDRGLITPIVFGAERKGLVEISATVKDLANKARAGKLQPHEFQGGTFSVSNLGMYGVHHFSAIINPPQACILALGGTTQKIVVADNDEGCKPITVMHATLSCDHRVVDGAVGAQWLSHFKSFLSNPAAILL